MLCGRAIMVAAAIHINEIATKKAVILMQSATKIVSKSSNQLT
jgi:hypothetical protein